MEPLTYTLTSYTENGKLYGLLVFNRKADMDTTKIKTIVNITLNGVPPSQYTWDASRINDTTYKINIQTSVSLN